MACLPRCTARCNHSSSSSRSRIRGRPSLTVHALGTTAPSGTSLLLERVQLPIQPDVVLNLAEHPETTLRPPYDQFKEQGQVVFKALSPADVVVLQAVLQQQSSSTEDVLQLGQQARPIVDDCLAETGALLLRGLPLATPEAVEAFFDGLGYSQMPYEPFASRRKKIGKLDAATNIPGQEILQLHNEMSYNPRPAAKIFLTCLNPAPQGGESLLGSTAELTARLPPHIIQHYASKGGVKYTRRYPSAAAAAARDPTAPPTSTEGLMPASWQERTGCSDKAGAEAFFTSLGCTVEWTGDDEDVMVAWNVQPAVVPHPTRPDLPPLWFNLGHTADSAAITYGDGTRLEQEVVGEVLAARLAVDRVLQLGPGDVLALDNYRYMHGRLPFKGEGRVMVTVLTSD